MQGQKFDLSPEELAKLGEDVLHLLRCQHPLIETFARQFPGKTGKDLVRWYMTLVMSFGKWATINAIAYVLTWTKKPDNPYSAVYAVARKGGFTKEFDGAYREPKE